MTTTTYTATYSPEDNKLRLYASARLDADTFARVKAAGFKWAPRQGLFVAPMWTPARVDLLEELAGEIGDEDTSLVARAEDRAERFDGYQERRRADSAAASAAAGEIAERFAGGQPILVGHHSERRARKDKERIDGAMRKAVKMWETADYWRERAAGALAHAKYKELPAVRARRIKTIEADKRKAERNRADAERKLAAWTAEGLTLDQARTLANYGSFNVAEVDGCRYSAWDVLRPAEERSEFSRCPTMTLDEVREKARAIYSGYLPKVARWIAHYEHRLTYERAMLEEQGASALLEKKPRRALPPLLNYRAPGGSITVPNPYIRRETITYPQVDMTKADYAKLYEGSRAVRLGPDRQHRFRCALQGHKLVAVFLTDSKEHPAPTSTTPPPAPDPAPLPPAPAPASRPTSSSSPEASAIDAMRKALKSGGVAVVTAPTLYPTPAELADRVAMLANVPAGGRVLEPSAGTGALLQALPGVLPFPGSRQSWCEVVAVELAPALARLLEQSGLAGKVHCADFLELEPAEIGAFDVVLMNPPFDGGADIRHIEHARRFLKPGGRLVAICANGPRQQRALQPLASSWEPLPAGTFKAAGTMVNTALLVIDATPAPAAELEQPRGQLALL